MRQYGLSIYGLQDDGIKGGLLWDIDMKLL